MTVTSPWLRRLGPPLDAGAELICFPHAGGSAVAHRPLAAVLAGRVAVTGVQYPGRQDRIAEPVVTDLHALADAVAQQLAAADAGIPRVFFGHSMGAIVAYETALRLGDAGPVHLIAAGRPAPSRIRDTHAHLLSDDALLEQVVELGGTEVELLDHPELRELVLPVIRGDYRASETYRQREGQGLGCPVTVLVGDADPLTPLADARAWAPHTMGPCRVRVLPGDHFFVSGHWGTVADVARQALEAVPA
ncbi:thioesterase II family protein [Streptomyces sp. NPDC054794]